MSDQIPQHCPGTESENAGKSSACEGCPNQQICASATPKGPDPDVDMITQKLANVKSKILILSGKGGVGKSTLTAMLSRALAASDENINVGVLDIDLCGPSAPRMFGVLDEQVSLQILMPSKSFHAFYVYTCQNSCLLPVADFSRRRKRYFEGFSYVGGLCSNCGNCKGKKYLVCSAQVNLISRKLKK